ncbi:MAG TPA: preprotein translocase subunit SecG [Chitinispirillaceae bacterium]|jgi:preprotein translocase subunit SecG|nr:preprotein translocase subunit SecG [Chitinispirillaceae bacterium]
MLFGILVVIFVLVCIFLCLLILIQSDKGGGISGAIGGGLGGANSLLGTQDTANILTRGTAIFGSAFLILCVVMSFVVGKQSVTGQKSILQERAQKQQSYSPSSVLEGKGLPLQQGTEQTAPAGSGEASELPIVPPAE